MKMNTDSALALNNVQSTTNPDFKNKLDTQGNIVDGGILLKPSVFDGDGKLSLYKSDGEDNDANNKLTNKSTSKDPPKDSTGGSGQQPQISLRKDRYGVKITRAKKHKVTFKDQVGKGKVAKVYLVECYKKFNVESTNTT
jgi:hypothetical protein